MDATQKRRIRKVASIHFGLTVCVVLVLMFWNGLSASKGGPFNASLVEQHVIHETWMQFWLMVLMLMQPLAVLVNLFLQLAVLHSILPNHPVWLMAPFIYLSIFLSVLLWSLCFGWIYVKFFNWLNHFSALGKRLF
jgi:hypothetical protein